ncbi:MAG TPA: heterodisulfide reductase-related iron-sulfur binding cluster [Dissulfurispiraceae bacterium]|nr:heterodisulfide reductase-related iron-sulfur binding cluster [Dissulfurispiraceae bacterium]
MDHNRAKERENQCIQEQPPKCMAACPVHVDARSMIDCVRRGDYKAGFAIFNKTVPFPGIISRICDHPCQTACKRSDVDATIMINSLERACADYSDSATKKPLMLPKKEKKVAVIGSGLSGLTAAVDLATKGYRVSTFEAADRPGGHLREFGVETLPSDAIEKDLSLLNALDVSLHLNSPLGNPQEDLNIDYLLAEFDAVYLGIGPAPVESLLHGLVDTSDGLITITPLTYSTSHQKIFAGGGHRYGHIYSPITSMMDGRLAAVSIDRFLQGASLTANRELEGPFETRLFTKTDGVSPKPATPMANRFNGYAREEAEAEAARCLNCQCLECVKVCEYLAHYKSYPKRYVREIYNNDAIIMGSHNANRMINTCALCSLCKAVCPVDLDMSEICLDARQSMVGKGKMPPSAHDFALRDMAFSNSDAFTLARHEPGHSTSNSIFFPGCQLSASSPEQVTQIYEYLRRNLSDGVGLVLGCCGAPADWAGEKAITDTAISAFADILKKMGSPKIITACSSCLRLFRNHLPDAQVESVQTILAINPLPESASVKTPEHVTIHDACASRHDHAVQGNVRCILEKLGVKISELADNRHLTPCCSYGGLMSLANAEVAEKVVRRRISESDADYVTYCAMCRDNFAARGKRAFHIFDLIWPPSDEDPAARKGPGYSKRHENRAKLKLHLLRNVWNEKTAEEDKPMKLNIPPDVTELLEARMILIEDIRKVIAHAESAGQRLLDRKSGHFIAHYKPVSVTYWVEYSSDGIEFTIHNAYSHRMELIEGISK